MSDDDTYPFSVPADAVAKADAALVNHFLDPAFTASGQYMTLVAACRAARAAAPPSESRYSGLWPGRTDEVPPQPCRSAKARQMKEAVNAVLAAADFKDQPTNSVNIPRELIERLREVSR